MGNQELKNQVEGNFKKPTLFEALIPMVVLIGLLALNVSIFDDTIAGSNEIALLFSAGIAGLIAFKNKMTWDSIQKTILKTIDSSMPAVLILLFIGSLAGTWMISGVVPVMIYYGLDIINPQIFLFSAVVVSALVSISTGSSWSTIATIGVALLGIGTALGFKPELVAGAIISGAYFGDKMSPLSDTTNLAPAMAGTDLFTHVRYMIYTTVPSILITLVIFLIIGFNYNTSGEADILAVKKAIEGTFNVSLWILLIPAILFFLIVKKVPPVPALMAGTLLGAAGVVIFQPEVLKNLSGMDNPDAKRTYEIVVQSMFGSTSIVTPNEDVNQLLSTSGMGGMLNTIWLIISAMVFGGVMEAAGFLERMTQSILKYAKNTPSLVASTTITSIFFNYTASDQYLTIVVAGRMYNRVYRERGLKPEVLSRTLEDSGTVTSVLVPWNTCGAAQSKVLGIGTFAYLPYCFFNLISPVVTILVALFNYKIRRFSKEEMQQINREIIEKAEGIE